jgi:hypothetical protein
MPPKQRQIRMEPRGAQDAIAALEHRSDEELEAETRFKAAAMTILGARAAERQDAPAARTYFRRAIAAAPPQQRMQIRRMADAAIALAERRPDDLKVAVERLGQTAPPRKHMVILRLLSFIVPPPGSHILIRLRGFASIFLIIVLLLAVGAGLVKLVSWPFGGLSWPASVLLGLFVAIAAISIMFVFGRRKRRKVEAGRGGADAAPARKR